MLAIWSLVPLPFLKPAWTSGSSQFTYCWSLAWRIWALLYKRVRWVQLCGSLSLLLHCLPLVLEWKLTFSSPVATAEFSKIAGILSAYFHSIIFQDLKELNWNSITSTSFVRIFLKVVPRASQVVLVVKNPPANAGDIRHGFDPWVGKFPWGRAWQPTPVFLPGESHGERSLMGYSPWGCTESDTTDVT